MTYDEIIQKLESISCPEDVEGMARFGINPKKTYAVRIPELRKIAKETGKNHELAAELWKAGYRETRILACMIDDPSQVTSSQMDEWAAEFDYWEICDQCCMKLFCNTPYAYEKVFQWSQQGEEFIKRSAFALIAVLAVHDKKAADEKFEQFFPLIVMEATDNRNYVKKSVNWALRHIGKRNTRLNEKAILVASEIQKIPSKSAKWIASNALRELQSEKVKEKLLKNNLNP